MGWTVGVADQEAPIVARQTALNLEFEGVETNDDQTPENIEAGLPADVLSYYLVGVVSTDDSVQLRSQVFTGPGVFSWPNVLLPVAGNWQFYVVSTLTGNPVGLPLTFTAVDPS